MIKPVDNTIKNPKYPYEIPTPIADIPMANEAKMLEIAINNLVIEKLYLDGKVGIPAVV